MHNLIDIQYSFNVGLTRAIQFMDLMVCRITVIPTLRNPFFVVIEQYGLWANTMSLSVNYNLIKKKSAMMNQEPLLTAQHLVAYDGKL